MGERRTPATAVRERAVVDEGRDEERDEERDEAKGLRSGDAAADPRTGGSADRSA
jgi:hypothetical protein